ncbi:protein-domain-containing protein [Syncephalastrum racemosum]|uniref:Protein-domain-containing protein n=1 Tax=Syncephalastrum racemosum TaxID=13706 RepID=A0A1X2HJE7_SYNRA|nr:protein-domain-containing protein [Syncephalastrum racemosum]
MEQSDTAIVSELFDDQLGDARDELDLELARCYARYHDATKDLTDLEVHSHNQTMIEKHKHHYPDTISALLYSILTRPDTARAQMPHLSSINRDSYATLFAKLQTLAMHIRFQQLKTTVRHQILWLLSELASIKVPNLEGIYLCLFRQVRSGDLSPRNVSFCDHLMRFCESHMRTLENYPRVVATAVYTYLRMIPDHRSSQYTALQQREIHFVLTLMRTKWPVCCMIGRDLVRILQDVATIPEIAQFWQTVLENPQSLSPHFQGIEGLLKTPTPRDFIRSRLPFDVELRLLWILQNLPTTRYQRNLSWFLPRHVQHENYYVDIIRYLVAGWYPSNQILQSDVVPRYVVIGSIIRGIKSQTVAANVKLALVFDWLFFAAGDNIMLIEPAMLLMERSAQRYPQITNTIMDFLVSSISLYHPPLKDYMLDCVTCGMRSLLEKGVIRSLVPLYNCQTLDPTIRHHMKRLFDQFLHLGPPAATPELAPNPPLLPIPAPIPAVAGSAAPATRDPRLQAQQRQQQQAQVSLMETPLALPGEPRREPTLDQGAVTEDDIDDFLYGNTDDTRSTTPGTVTTVDQEELAKRSPEEPMELIDGMAPEPSRPTAWDGLSVTMAGTPTSSINDMNHNLEMSDAVADDAAQLGVYGDAEREAYGDEDEEEVMEEEEEEEGGNVSQEDEEEETAYAHGLQKNQSYWIFGDSLDRFQKASQALTAARAAQDTEAVNEAHRTTKQCLHDILGVFLRVAIPPQSLAATLAPALRSSVDLPLASRTSLTVTSCLSDPTLDVLDLLFAFFWEVKEHDAAGTEKLIYLLSGIAACYRKGNQHLIGGRWWHAMARQLHSDASAQEDIDRLQVEWFPVIVDCYESYVAEMLSKDAKADESQRHQAIRDMLTADIKFLAELDLMLFHDLLPFVYHHMPTYCTGNSELLKLACQTILPAQMGRFIGHIQSGLIQPFGDSLLPDLLVDSFEWDAWDTVHLWRILVAEVQGDVDKTEKLFQHPGVVELFRSKDELLPDIHTLFTQAKPTSPLLAILVSLSHHASKTSQTAENVLQHWYDKNHDVLLDTLSQQVDAALADDTNGEPGRFLVTSLARWVRHATADGSAPLSEAHVRDRLSELASKLDEDWPTRSS